MASNKIRRMTIERAQQTELELLLLPLLLLGRQGG
jgi:hypothetical protein